MSNQFFTQPAVVDIEALEDATIRALKDVDRLLKVNASGAQDEAGQQFNQILSASTGSLVEQTYKNAATSTKVLQP